MTQAENEVIETFCKELALVLRRITGSNIDISQETLIKEIKVIDREMDNQPKHISSYQRGNAE